ncbi:MAG: hypothetical protein WC966_10835 [Bradymonadales bacterium]
MFRVATVLFILSIILLPYGCEFDDAMLPENYGEPCKHNTNQFGLCNRYELCDASDSCIMAGEYCQSSYENTNGFGYCLNEHACTMGRCVRGAISCDVDGVCPEPLNCRNGTCVCGEKGGVCGDSQQCCLQNGGYCVNLVENKMSSCGVCSAGYANCNENWSDGCEIQLWGSDPNNCGACAKQCTLPSVCIAGQCGGSGCADDEHLCYYDNTPYCMSTNLMKRINLQSCMRCSAGYANLDKDWRNGCESPENLYR